MKKKQNSIDSFVEQLKRKGLLLTEDSEYIIAYLEAKAMHKEEIKDAVNSCGYQDEAEYYYNETFGGEDEN